MSALEIILVVVFLASAALGYKLINAVPSLLHTPLMSGMNALSGITILGIIAAVINVVAGFGVTERMLRMFKSGKEAEGEGS